MAAFALELPPAGAEPMTLGSPTSPKPGAGAQFLPGFLMGDLPAPMTPQPRSLSGPSVGVMEMRSPLLTGGSPPQPVVPTHKDKSGAPPVRSIYDELSSPGLGSTPLTSRKPPSYSVTQSPLVGTMPATPGTGDKCEQESTALFWLQYCNNKQELCGRTPAVLNTEAEVAALKEYYGDETWCHHSKASSFPCMNPAASCKAFCWVLCSHSSLCTVDAGSGFGPISSSSQRRCATGVFSPASIGQPRKTTLSPAQLDPFYTQGDSLTSEDHLDDTWVTVFGFPQASASYILLQFAQYGNILKHVMSNTGNWMHIRYQSKLQARKALSKDGRIFGESIMIGVKPCIDKSVMESFDRGSASSMSSVFTPPTKTLGTPMQPASTPRISTMRPLATAYKASTSDYQVVSDRQTPRKDESIVSKAMEYMFGW